LLLPSLDLRVKLALRELEQRAALLDDFHIFARELSSSPEAIKNKVGKFRIKC
jgi:hypothetical protein